MPRPLPAASDKTGDGNLDAKKEIKEDVIGKIIALLPRTEDQKRDALAKIEDGYFHLGDLYYFNLNEKDNAAESYEICCGASPNPSIPRGTL